MMEHSLIHPMTEDSPWNSPAEQDRWSRDLTQPLLIVGQIVDIHLIPEEAYGMPDPNAIFTVEIAQLPGAENLEVGQQVYLSNQLGQPFPVKVIAKEEATITFDANHEMAGKELNFRIELVEVK